MYHKGLLTYEEASLWVGLLVRVKLVNLHRAAFNDKAATKPGIFYYRLRLIIIL